MSKIALTPNASGTGTFTLAAPNSNTSRTITLPDEAGEVLVNGTNQNVGIGTSSPSTALDVLSGSASVSALKVKNASGASASTPILEAINGGGNTRLIVLNDGSVGIGTTTSAGKLTVDGSVVSQSAAQGAGDLQLQGYGATSYINHSGTGSLIFRMGTGYSEKARLDSSGNLLVGTTSSNVANQTGTTQGVRIAGAQNIQVASTGISAYFNKLDTDGDIVEFRKSGSKVGSIGVSGGDLTVSSSGSNPLRLQYNGNSVAKVESNSFNPANDNFQDLGQLSARWDDIYATNGTIQTSDRNQKQDIEVLSDAETRVAVACKGLLRKFRWQDAVAEKGDDARIHFGIIAQDLQDAFAAEGLDAGRYAMFISSTWWETQTEVPAVEAVDAVYEDVVIPAVLDEEGNELEAERTEQQLVTEAVEAKDAYTRTDTYETQAEAPEGATERTRLGVRYPELLAFIIGAM